MEDLYVDQLVALVDVTHRVHAAVDVAEGEQAKTEALERVLGELQEEYDLANGLINEVVELYNGGRYSVYTYRRYNDVRLVMAPELALGYFGGDPDNFTYPRYNLDVSFFRVWEEDGPLDSSDFFFPWSTSGPRQGEPVFVIGNPGTTSRLNTVAQLAFTRDYENPAILRLYRNRIKAYRAYLDAHPEAPGWEALNNLYFNLTNGEKAISGQQAGLLDPWLLARKGTWERELRRRVLDDPSLAARFGDPWSEIDQIRQQLAPFGFQQYALSFGGQVRSALLNRAFLLDQYRYMLQQGLPADSPQLQGLASQLTRPLDSSLELEQALLAVQLDEMRIWLGAEDPLIQGLIGMRSAAAAAGALVRGTVLTDSTVTARLLAGGPQAMREAEDPIVQAFFGMVERVIPMQQQLVQLFEQEEAARRRLARALFEVHGTRIPPDATFTLRISDGVVEGFPYNGTEAPAWTTYYGLYDRWASRDGLDPWALPPRWQSPPAAFDLATPLNFVATTDIIGGNSGSAVVNRNLEVVGAAFDGNMESLPGEFIFLPLRNRTVAVHSAGVLAAIQHLYGYQELARELTYGGRSIGGR